MAVSEAGVIVCQGLPVCALTGDAAIAEQNLGCPWCQRIYYDEFGNREVVEPYNDRPNKD